MTGLYTKLHTKLNWVHHNSHTHIQFRNFKRLIPYLKTLYRPSHHFPAIKKIRKKTLDRLFLLHLNWEKKDSSWALRFLLVLEMGTY